MRDVLQQAELVQLVQRLADKESVTCDQISLGTHLPSEQVLSSRYSGLGGSGPGDMEARAFALARGVFWLHGGRLPT
jgi:hypothetical protein